VKKSAWFPLPSFRRKPESRVPGENRDPAFEIIPYFRRDGLWTPVFTGVTTFYEIINLDELVKSQKTGFSVIPAKAGIQLFQGVLDPGFRRCADKNRRDVVNERVIR
jgi:hypothetical protein